MKTKSFPKPETSTMIALLLFSSLILAACVTAVPGQGDPTSGATPQPVGETPGSKPTGLPLPIILHPKRYFTETGSG
ncbi:MAG: hypothetical protein A2136_08085 [Chloroflexi bacterium RBG_16_54_11]|nr:MAG: hypothetical protein A2136_08085 [Chloroflexi bacterium RBG_16_54_11]